jgi:uncharacterized membrane protein YhaH (DUF805 family)
MSVRDVLSDFSAFLERRRVRSLLFGYEGRISREQYWFAWLCWLIAWMAFAAIFVVVGWLGYVMLVLGCALWLVSFNSYIAVGVKRLHDRGKSGWWMLVFAGWPFVLTGVAFIVGPVAVLDLVSLGVVGWMIVELGCLRGTDGANAYGPLPAVAAAAPAKAD